MSIKLIQCLTRDGHVTPSSKITEVQTLDPHQVPIGNDLLSFAFFDSLSNATVSPRYMVNVEQVSINDLSPMLQAAALMARVTTVWRHKFRTDYVSARFPSDIPITDVPNPLGLIDDNPDIGLVALRRELTKSKLLTLV